MPKILKYTKEQLLSFLQKLNNELKKTPTLKDLKNINYKNKKYNIKYPSSTTYIKRFKSWNNALVLAGLKINKKEFTKQELIENLKIIAKEISKTPKPKDLKERKWAGSYSTYIKTFRTWKNALREANLEKQSSSLKKFTKKR
jgi:hypothetical protein